VLNLILGGKMLPVSPVKRVGINAVKERKGCQTDQKIGLIFRKNGNFGGDFWYV